jgi:hypothetical protein
MFLKCGCAELCHNFIFTGRETNGIIVTNRYKTENHPILNFELAIKLVMITHRIKLGQAIILEPDIAEIVVDEGITLDLDMVHDYHDWIRTNMPDPCFVLINKRNAFVYEFDAQLEVGTIKQIKAVAFYTPSDTSYHVTEMLAQLPRKLDWIYKLFYTHDEALYWLKKQRKYN